MNEGRKRFRGAEPVVKKSLGPEVSRACTGSFDSARLVSLRSG
jgi:hypothetical protein